MSASNLLFPEPVGPTILITCPAKISTWIFSASPNLFLPPLMVNLCTFTSSLFSKFCIAERYFFSSSAILPSRIPTCHKSSSSISSKALAKVKLSGKFHRPVLSK